MVNFFKEIGNGLKDAANFIGSKVDEGFNDIKNIATSSEGEIKNVADQGFGLANHLVSGAEDLGSKTIDGVKGTITGAENILTIPLILIAGGLAFFLLSPNAGKAIEVGGQALKNPAVMGI